MVPKEFGIVLWRGGAGRPGEKGGWGFRCSWCTIGDRRSADPRKHVSERELVTHVLDKHPAQVKEIEKPEKDT